MLPNPANGFLISCTFIYFLLLILQFGNWWRPHDDDDSTSCWRWQRESAPRQQVGNNFNTQCANYLSPWQGQVNGARAVSKNLKHLSDHGDIEGEEIELEEVHQWYVYEWNISMLPNHANGFLISCTFIYFLLLILQFGNWWRPHDDDDSTSCWRWQRESAPRQQVGNNFNTQCANYLSPWQGQVNGARAVSKNLKHLSDHGDIEGEEIELEEVHQWYVYEWNISMLHNHANGFLISCTFIYFLLLILQFGNWWRPHDDDDSTSCWRWQRESAPRQQVGNNFNTQCANYLSPWQGQVNGARAVSKNLKHLSDHDDIEGEEIELEEVHQWYVYEWNISMLPNPANGFLISCTFIYFLLLILQFGNWWWSHDDDDSTSCWRWQRESAPRQQVGNNFNTQCANYLSPWHGQVNWARVVSKKFKTP